MNEVKQNELSLVLKLKINWQPSCGEVDVNYYQKSKHICNGVTTSSLKVMNVQEREYPMLRAILTFK